METLIAALILVESGNNDLAVRRERNGDYSFGCLQLKAIFVRDWNRIAKRNAKHTDAFNRQWSINAVERVLAHYCTAKRLGHEPTDYDRAMCFHYGSRAALTTTDPDGYWAKVVKAMETQP